MPNVRAAAVLVSVLAAAGCPEGKKAARPDAERSTVTVDRATGVVADGVDKATITVTVKDASDQPLAGQVVVLTATGNGNTVGQPPSTTDASGVATGTIASTVPGVKTITAIVGTQEPVMLAQQVTVEFVPATPPVATQLAFTVQPSAATAGIDFVPAVVVAIRDAQGNLVPGATNAVTLALSGGPAGATLLGTTTVNAVGGLATFSNLRIEKAGLGYRLVASAQGLQGATSAPFAVQPAAASKLAFRTQPSSTIAGDEISPPVAVEIQDPFGNVVMTDSRAVTVALAANPTNATLAGTTTRDAAQGVASFDDLVIEKAGTGYTLAASAAGLAGATSAAFSVTAGPAVALSVTGLPASAIAGATSSVTVTALDEFGNTVTSYGGTVAFASDDPQATLPADYTFDAGDAGTHTFVGGVTLRTAGSRTVTVTDTFDPTLDGSQTVTVTPAAASRLSVTGIASPVVAGTVSTVTVTALDPFGNRATGYSGTVAFTSDDPQATLPPNYTFVAADEGTRTFASGVTLRTSGSRTVTATDTVTASVTGGQTVSVTPGDAALLAFVGQPSNIDAGRPFTPAVRVEVQDLFGNVVSTGPAATTEVTLSLLGGTSGAMLLGTNPVRAAAGVATFSNLSVDKAGTGYTLRATAADLAADDSDPFDVAPAQLASFSVTGLPDPYTAGAAVTVTVTARDSLGNTVTGYTGTVVFSSTDGQAELPGSYTFQASDNGVHAFPNVRLKTAGMQSVTVRDQTQTTVSGTQTANVLPAGADRLAFTTQPANRTADQLLPEIRVAVRDPYGNTVTGSTASITIALDPSSSGGATVEGTATVTAADGVATFSDLAVRKAGTGYRLVASSSPALAGATSDPFDIAPGAAAAVAFLVEPPANVIAGAEFSVEVEVQDAFSNRVTSAMNEVTVDLGNAPSGATLNGTKTVMAVGGVATFTGLRIERAGNDFTLVATAGGLLPDTSRTFNVNPDAVARLALTGIPSTVTAGAASSPTVTAQDAFGNTVSSYTGTVRFSSTDPGASLPADYAFTSTDLGAHTFAAGVTLRRAGPQTVTVTDTGTASLTGSQTVTVEPGQAAALTFEVQPTDTMVSQTISPAPQVAIRDAFGNLRTSDTSTIEMTLHPGSGTPGARLEGTLSVAAQGGIATFPDLRIDRAGTGYQLHAMTGAISGASAPFTVFGLPAIGDLMVTEVMHSPTGDVREREWFEIRNVSTRPLALGGLVVEVQASSTATFVVTGSPIVAPGAFFVFGASSEPATNGGATVHFVYPSDVVLGVDGRITIRSGADPIEELTWDDLTFPSMTGRAMQVSQAVMAGDANQYPWYWCNTPNIDAYRMSGGDFGTPGAANDGCGIAVTPPVDFCRLQFPPNIPLLDSLDSATVYGQFYEPHVTDRNQPGNDFYPWVRGAVGYGTDANDPASWTWLPATFNPSYAESNPSENDDEMQAMLSIPTAGTYRYGYRFQLLNPATGANDGAPVYCTLDGRFGAEGGTNWGTVTVSEASAQIAAARAAPDGTLATPIRIDGALVTYVKPLVGNDPAGFFVQGRQMGPALFVAVDPATLSPPPAVGDRIAFTVTAMGTAGMLRQATGVDSYARQSQGNLVAPLVQDVSGAADLVTNLAAYESEVVRLTGTIASAFGSAGAGHESAQIDTAGISGDTNLKLRVPSTLRDELDLVPTCNITLHRTPMWRFNAQAQPSAWVAADVTRNACPAPRVLAATATGAQTVVVSFDRRIDGATLAANGSQFTILEGLSVTAAALTAPRAVTLTTASQVAGATYTLDVANTLKDTMGNGIDALFDTATFYGFTPPCSPSNVVISQVYGGGGNSGAPYQNDFIELHNRALVPVNITGWSVQQASATGTSWNRFNLSGTIPPGGYFLVSGAAGTSCSGSPCGSPLPAPDAVSPLNMGATGAKVALVASQTTLSGSCPSSADIVDFVGWGTTSSGTPADCFEGASRGPTTSNSTAALRLDNRCRDTNENGADFSATTPEPRNSQSAANNCGCGGP